VPRRTLRAQTVSGHSLVHFTFFPDTGAVHFHEDVYGKAVAVPLDGDRSDLYRELLV
jgi:hypothetical protein